MTLDKTELLGRPMNIGRPKGYVPGTSAPGEYAVDEHMLDISSLLHGPRNLQQQLLPRNTQGLFVLQCPNPWTVDGVVMRAFKHLQHLKHVETRLWVA